MSVMAIGLRLDGIKVPLSTKVGLSPGHTVLDGDPAFPLPQKGAQPPNGRPSQLLLSIGMIDRLHMKNVCVQLKYPFVRICAFCVF